MDRMPCLPGSIQASKPGIEKGPFGPFRLQQLGLLARFVRARFRRGGLGHQIHILFLIQGLGEASIMEIGRAHV